MSIDFLVELTKTWLYPALAATWFVNALLAVLFYANRLRHPHYRSRMLAYVSIALTYVLLSLATGLNPILTADQISPSLVIVRLGQLVFGLGIGRELWRRLRQE